MGRPEDPGVKTTPGAPSTQLEMGPPQKADATPRKRKAATGALGPNKSALGELDLAGGSGVLGGEMERRSPNSDF